MTVTAVPWAGMAGGPEHDPEVDTGFLERPCSKNNPEHDPEKWIPVFGKDHAPKITGSAMTIR